MKNRLLSLRAGAVYALGLAIALFLAAGARAAEGPFALSFDGANDYVSVPHSTLFNGYQLTVTAWIKNHSNGRRAGAGQ
jgi:hypothetical protein